MNYKGHLNGGLVTATANGIISSVLVDIKVGIVCFFTALIFALYPDMDTGSIPRRYLSIAGVIGIILCVYLGKVWAAGILGGLIVFPTMCKHRGVTHSITFMMVITVVWLCFLSYFVRVDWHWNLPYNWAVVTGFMTHFILDKHLKIGI